MKKKVKTLKLLRAWFSFLARYTRKKKLTLVYGRYSSCYWHCCGTKLQTATKSSALDYTVPILMK